MKRLLLLSVLVAATACGKTGAGAGGGIATSAPKTEEEKTLYAMGLALGRNVEPMSLTPAELSQVLKGLSDQALGQPTAVSLEEYGPKIQAFARPRAEAHTKAKAEKEKAKSK